MRTIKCSFSHVKLAIATSSIKMMGTVASHAIRRTRKPCLFTVSVSKLLTAAGLSTYIVLVRSASIFYALPAAFSTRFTTTLIKSNNSPLAKN